MSNTFKLVTDKTELVKMIDNVGKRSVKLQMDIHAAACGVLTHHDTHGDVTLVNRLYNALGDGQRKATLAQWFMTFGRLSANTDKETKVEKPFLHDASKAADLETAYVTPYFSLIVEKAPDAIFDIAKAYAALIRKIDKAAKEGRPVEGFSEEQMRALRNVGIMSEVAEDVQDSGLLDLNIEA